MRIPGTGSDLRPNDVLVHASGKRFEVLCVATRYVFLKCEIDGHLFCESRAVFNCALRHGAVLERNGKTLTKVPS